METLAAWIQTVAPGSGGRQCVGKEGGGRTALHTHRAPGPSLSPPWSSLCFGAVPPLLPMLLAPQALSMQPPLQAPLWAQNPFLCSTLRCPDLLQGLAPVLLHSFIPHPFLQKLSAECLCLSNQNKLYRLRT